MKNPRETMENPLLHTPCCPSCVGSMHVNPPKAMIHSMPAVSTTTNISILPPPQPTNNKTTASTYFNHAIMAITMSVLPYPPCHV